MSLKTGSKKDSAAQEIIAAMKAFPIDQCRLRLAEELERGTFDPENAALFHSVMNATLEHCGVPTIYISDSLGASFSTVERWAEGASRPHTMVIRVLYEQLPDMLRGQTKELPQYLPEESALRMLEKMKQLPMAECRRQLTSLLHGFAFDPGQKKTFEVLMTVVLRQCRVAAVSMANMLNLTPSTIYRWTGNSNEPLLKTRRRALHVLPYLLTNE